MSTDAGRNPIALLLGIAVTALVLFGIFLFMADPGPGPGTAAPPPGDPQAAAPAADPTPPEPATQDRSRETTVLIDQALRQITSNDSETQCEGAEALGRLRAVDEWQKLETLLDRSEHPSVKVCAAAALVQLGQTGPAMQAYERWARGDDGGLKASALSGFGQIGPPAAEVAMPYLGDALKSPHRYMRFAATDALTKIGPSGIPLLKIAAEDADPGISRHATNALSRTGR